MNTQTLSAKKITLATVKSFLKANANHLYINVKDKFSGMVDGLESHHAGFQEVKITTEHMEYTKGITGAWFVGESRDYFTFYCKDGFEGIQVDNSCGRFILAVKI